MADPYPTYQRLLEEAPLYYNERYDFYAVSRFDDCRDGLRDARSYISGRGGILEIIKADMEMPSWVIGIPESDLEAVRDWVDANLRTRPGEPMQPGTEGFSDGMIAEYIDWRVEHPSDDVMTALLHTEFEDETGTVRT